MTIMDRITARRLPPPELARAIRKAAGATQAELAAELGVSQATVARWELGLRHPRPAEAERYAAALDELSKVQP